MYKNNPEFYAVRGTHEVVKKNLPRYFSDPICKESFLDSEEIDKVFELGFRTQPNVSKFSNGFILLFGNIYEIFDYLKPKLAKTIGPEVLDVPAVGGHYFIHSCGARIHNDGIREQDYIKSLDAVPESSSLRQYVPWKNVLLPLWFASENVHNYAGELVFF